MTSWILLRVQADALELKATFSPFEARYLLTELDPEQVVIDPDTFPRLEKMLQAAGRTLFVMQVGDEKLEPLDSAVVETPEEDLEFIVHYPRPAGGRLRMDAVYLQRMSLDHMALLSILDEKNQMLAGFSPTPDEPNASVMLPPRGATPATTSGKP